MKVSELEVRFIRKKFLVNGQYAKWIGCMESDNELVFEDPKHKGRTMTVWLPDDYELGDPK